MARKINDVERRQVLQMPSVLSSQSPSLLHTPRLSPEGPLSLPLGQVQGSVENTALRNTTITPGNRPDPQNPGTHSHRPSLRSTPEQEMRAQLPTSSTMNPTTAAKTPRPNDKEADMANKPEIRLESYNEIAAKYPPQPRTRLLTNAESYAAAMQIMMKRLDIAAEKPEKISANNADKPPRKKTGKGTKSKLERALSKKR